MYAIIETGGKQYRVQQGDVIFVEKLAAQTDAAITFDVLMKGGDGEKTVIGTPTIEGSSVTGKILGHGKGEKIVIYKYKAKKNYRRKQGHRQPYTKVEITAVS